MNNKDVQVTATEILNACSRVCPSSPLLSSSDDKKHTLVARPTDLDFETKLRDRNSHFFLINFFSVVLKFMRQIGSIHL